MRHEVLCASAGPTECGYGCGTGFRRRHCSAKRREKEQLAAGPLFFFYRYFEDWRMTSAISWEGVDDGTQHTSTQDRPLG